jgi:hypothetical protein
MKNVYFLSSRRLGLAWVLAGLAAVLPLQALSQAYPTKPVKVLVGFTAGGAVDLIARSVGQVMSAGLGQPVVVENKPGAGTNIAMKALIDAPPDGYMLMLTANSIAANPALYKPAPFDPEKDVAPVALVGRVPVVIAANAASPYTSVGQLIQAAKGKPNTIAYGSPGNGATPHMAMEFFTRAAGVDLQHIPYKGGSQAITDVILHQDPRLARLVHRPAKPRFQLPAGAWTRTATCSAPAPSFPTRPSASTRPATPASTQLFALRDHLGFARNVIVQATCHGADNRAMVDACLASGGKARGVATVQAQRHRRRTAAAARRRRARRALQLRQAPGGLHAQGRADGDRRPHRPAGLARGDLLSRRWTCPSCGTSSPRCPPPWWWTTWAART